MSQALPLIIIGTGLAGYSLAREFRKLDADTPVLMLSQDDGHSYSKPMLSTGFTKNKSADDLSMADPGKMAAQLKVSIRNFTDVTRINTESKQIEIGKEVLPYERVVLATGASVNTLSFPGSDNPKILSINDLMDYRQFRDTLEEKKHVLIMGAGLIGCEYANDLLNGEYQVTIVDPSKSALNGLIPDTAGDALIEGLKRAGANFKMSTYVTELVEKNGVLCAKLNDASEVSCDLIISAVGLQPEISLAQASGLKCNRGIATDAYLQTSQQDIYALGDCAEIEGTVRLYVLPLMESARKLAKTLSGQPTAIQFGPMPIATKTPACAIVTCPPNGQDGQWEFEQDDIHISGKFFNSNNELVGFVLTGNCIQEKQALLKALNNSHD